MLVKKGMTLGMSYEGSVLCWQKHILYIVDCNYRPKTILLIWRFTFLGQLLCAKCNRTYFVSRMQSVVPKCMKLLWNHVTPQCLLSMKNTKALALCPQNIEGSTFFHVQKTRWMINVYSIYSRNSRLQLRIYNVSKLMLCLLFCWQKAECTYFIDKNNGSINR